MRARLVVGSVALAALVVGAAAAPGTASGAVDDDLITTSSTRTVGWEPRNPLDGPDATNRAPYDDLKNWKVRVSQTSDLLNQTVQVSWTGAPQTGNGLFVQVMQCWSDGPSVPPTREQCAYGGIDRDGASTTGSGRTRGLGADPRERVYRNDGEMQVAAVNDARPGSTWQGSDRLVLGTDAAKSCPTGTAAGRLAGVLPNKARVDLVSSNAPPSSYTLAVNGGSQVFGVATPAFTLDGVVAAANLRAPLQGEYRFELSCLDGTGGELVRFVGFLQYAGDTTSPTPRWRPSFRFDTGVYVPFDPVGDTADTAPTDPYQRDEVLEYIKPRSTNEVWQARSRPDGSGQVFMEMQTDLEAQHLACGRKDGGTVRSCWLVAVPRWAGEPDGTDLVISTMSSPLSQTNWDRRIAVPLRFAPVESGCKIGSGLKQILANDSSLAALRSWQPTFCADSATASSVLGPLQDFGVRAGVQAPNRLGVVGIPEEGRSTQVRAPLTTSGVVVAYWFDRVIRYGSQQYDRNATRETVLNLNPRLVAKLLTQSYDSGAAPNGGKTSGYNASEYSGGFKPAFTPARSFPTDNPRRLIDDPEFLALNPQIKTWLADSSSISPAVLGDLLVSASDADAYQAVWQWILGDRDAAAFLRGSPDPYGMRVNPYYKNQPTREQSSFPLLDPTCVDDIPDPAAKDFPLLCQINNHPRVEDDTEAAQAAVRGDTRRVNVAPLSFGGLASDRSYRAEPRQTQGQQAMLVLTTSAVAQRFGLPTARLRNKDAKYVAATTESMTAARSVMRVRPDGVLVPAPEQVGGAGYPLTTMSYAVVDVAKTTQPQNNAFASILAYAAGPGQTTGYAVGQLPPGYAPLSSGQRSQLLKAAALLRNPASLLPKPGGNGPGAGGGGAGGAGGGGSGSSGGGTSGGASGGGGAGGAGAGNGNGAAPVVAPPNPASAPGVRGTPTTPQPASLASTQGVIPPLGMVLPILLLAGVVGAVAGPVLNARARRRG